MAIVYQHIQKNNNEVFYIGIGKSEKRAYSKNGRSEYWNYKAKKYGYYVEIIYNDIDWNLACNMERYLIESYGRKDLGLGNLVNLTDGGDGSLNTIVKESTKKKQSESRKGEKNHFYGKKHTIESVEKISKKAIERNQKGCRNPNYGNGAKISGEKNPMYGKKHSAETIEKLRENSKKTSKGHLNGKSKKVINTITNEVYLCAKYAYESNQFNYTLSYFIMQLNGRRKNTTPFKYIQND